MILSWYLLDAAACTPEKVETCVTDALAVRESRGLDAEALSWLEIACDAGRGLACSVLGAATARGEGRAADRKVAVELYARACKLGSTEGCANVAAEQVGTDPKAATAAFARLCAQGVGIACENAGSMYARGQGVAQNDAKAVEFYRAGCALSVGPECRQLAIRKLNGKGVKKDVQGGIALLEQMCTVGASSQCCSDLGITLEENFGTDDPRVLRTWEQACRLGDAYGCSTAGFMKLDLGDEASGKVLLGRGCEGGRLQACGALGRLAERAGQRDVARGFYDIACKGGLVQACEDAKKVRP